MLESILLSILGNATYDFLKKRINKTLEFFDYKKNGKDSPSASNPLLTPYPKPNERDVVGRDNNLAEVEVLLNTNKDMLMLSGMGGIGKTTLAAYYIQKNIENYNGIVWINVSQGFYEAFAYNKELIKSINIEEKLKKLHDTISFESYPEQAYIEITHQLNLNDGELLLVIDNAFEKQPLQSLRDRLKRNWKILVTTREPFGGFTQYQVEILESSEAINLFTSHYTRENNKVLIDEILQQVVYHTLSIELVAKTAQQKIGYTLQQLKIDLENNGLTIAKGIKIRTKYSQFGEHKEYKVHIRECLQNTFNIAQIGESENYLFALKHLCLLPTVFINFYFIIKLINIEDEVEKNNFNTTLNDLVYMGWLEQEGENYRIHPVIQETLQLQFYLEPKEVLSLITNVGMLLYGEVFEHGIDRIEFIPYAQIIFDYFIHKLDSITDDNKEEWEEIAMLIGNLSNTYSDINKIEKALEYQLIAIQIYERVLDDNNKNLAIIYNVHSTTYLQSKNYEKALMYQLKSLEIRKKNTEEPPLFLATSYHNLSTIFANLEKPDTALENEMIALKIFEKELEGDNFRFALSYHNLAWIFSIKEEFGVALEYQKKSMEIFEKVLDSDSPKWIKIYSVAIDIHKKLLNEKEELFYEEKLKRVKEKNVKRGLNS